MKNKYNYYRRWHHLLAVFFDLYARRNKDIYPRGGKLPEGGNLILANHVTRIDQFLIGIYYKDSYIRYVSGENVFRSKLLRRFAVGCLNVIIHMRGISSFDTVREMSRGLKRGENILIFPTGTMTFNGRSKKIDSAIAKLAKMSKCNLVLVKSTGGYLTQPRWGTNIRRGKINLTDYILSAEKIKGMSVQDITDEINERLYTDAYEQQELEMIEYKGKKLCKGLECCVYECPKCGRISGLKTSDTDLLCDCGFSARYDEYGYLLDRDGNKYTVSQLCDRQRENLKNRYLSAKTAASNELLFADELSINQLHHDGKRVDVGNFRVNIYSNRVEYCKGDLRTDIAFDDIESVFVYMRNTLNVNLADMEYGFELRGDFSFNALKYRDLFEIYKDINHIESEE